MWLGTFAGLVRFDGVRFTVFDPANSPGLPSERVLRLHVDREGGFWIATETRSLVRLWQGKFKTFGSHTVETHRANLCAKLDLHGSHPLLQFALEHRSEL